LPRAPIPALAALGAAVAVNLLTRTGAPLCRPGSLVQGHGAWHVLTAVAVGAWLVCWPSPGSTGRVPAPTGTTGAAGSGDAVAGADAGRDAGAG
jgi:hypothetical protein